MAGVEDEFEGISQQSPGELPASQQGLSQSPSRPSSRRSSGASLKSSRTKATGKGQGRAATGPAVKKSGDKPGAKKRAAPKPTCFICPEKKKPNSRFCVVHGPPADGLLYQAKRDGEEALVNEVLYDEAKATVAITDWIRDNGDRKRKEIVDWTQFGRKYGQRAENTMRRGQTQMDQVDYVYYHCRRNFLDPLDKASQALGKKEFKAQCDRHPGDVEYSTDGVPSLWVMDQKQRFKDRTLFLEGGITQGGKQVKNMKRAEIENLQKYVHNSYGDFDHKFLREGNLDAQNPTKALADINDVGGKDGPSALGVDVADAAPKQKKILRSFYQECENRFPISWRSARNCLPMCLQTAPTRSASTTNLHWSAGRWRWTPSWP